MAKKTNKPKKKKAVKVRQGLKFVHGITRAELQKKASRAVEKINDKGGRIDATSLTSAGLSVAILYTKK